MGYSKQDLINILSTQRDRDMRESAVYALIRLNMFDDEILEVIKELYKKEGIKHILSTMKHNIAVPFLVDILLNDYDPLNRQRVVRVLGDIGDPLAIPALEEALNYRDITVRQLSARALKKITGKEYEWKIEYNKTLQ